MYTDYQANNPLELTSNNVSNSLLALPAIVNFSLTKSTCISQCIFQAYWDNNLVVFSSDLPVI